MRKFHEQERTNAAGNQSHDNDIEKLAAAEPQPQGGNQFDITAANAPAGQDGQYQEQDAAAQSRSEMVEYGITVKNRGKKS